MALYVSLTLLLTISVSLCNAQAQPKLGPPVCSEGNADYPKNAPKGWTEYSNQIFRAAQNDDPIMVEDSFQAKTCEMDFYKAFSPIAYMADTPDADEESKRFGIVWQRKSDIESAWRLVQTDLPPKNEEEWKNETKGARMLFEAWSTTYNKSSFTNIEQALCYQFRNRFEALECVDGICNCPESRVFQLMKYRPGRHIAQNGKYTKNTMACVSGGGGYCVRNSLTCEGGVKCTSQGVSRPWPYQCVSGICQGSSKVIQGSLQLTLLLAILVLMY